MAKQFSFNISDTINDMVACDQMLAEIEAAIGVSLDQDPLGIICTKTIVQFNFTNDLSASQESDLTSVVAAHTGMGIPSPNTADSLTVAELPVVLDIGSSFYVTDGSGGPAPAYFDGADWRWYSDNSIVS